MATILRLCLVVMTMAMSVLAPTGAAATPATYRFVGDIAGTLAGNGVSGQLTLEVTGDTDDLTVTGPAQRLDSGASGQATFDLPGIGSFTVTNAYYVFVRPDLGTAGFGVRDLVNCCDIIQINNAGLLTGYDLNDAIGPVAGPDNPSLFDWFEVPTSAGLFTVTRMTNNTFEAIIGRSVPEPGLPALLALAAAGALLTGRRRRVAGRG